MNMSEHEAQAKKESDIAYWWSTSIAVILAVSVISLASTYWAPGYIESLRQETIQSVSSACIAEYWKSPLSDKEKDAVYSTCVSGGVKALTEGE